MKMMYVPIMFFSLAFGLHLSQDASVASLTNMVENSLSIILDILLPEKLLYR